MTALRASMPSVSETGTPHLALMRELLSGRGAEASALVGDRDDILLQLQGGARPRLIVLDVSHSTDAATDVATLRGAADGSQILVMGPVNDVHMFRALLGAGAADYVPLPTTRETLDAAIGRLLQATATDAAGASLGRVAVVIGTRGGVGTTTAAITLGWLLAEEASKRTAILDLDLQFGTVALSLDVDPGRGLRDALEKPERIDGLYLDRAIIRIGNNLFALSAEEPIEDSPIFDPASVGFLIDELRRKFDWIIIDLPRGTPRLAQAVMALASHTIIIADGTLAGLRDTMRLDALARTANPDQRVIVMKGGSTMERNGVSRAEFEKELGRPLDGAIPSDPKAAAEAANAGQPLPQVARASPVVLAIRQIVAKLAGTELKAKKFKLPIPFKRP
jgi:pilus assembly protein CpaE